MTDPWIPATLTRDGARWNEFAASIVVVLGRATEADTAQPVGRLVRRTVGTATETDSPRTVGHPVTELVGRAEAAATASGFTLASGTVVAVGRATETDVARTPAKTLNLVSVTELARPVSVALTAMVGRATVTSTAQPLAQATGGRVRKADYFEADVARKITVAIGPILYVPVGRASSTSTANPLSSRVVGRIVLGRATEFDAARKFQRRILGGVDEPADPAREPRGRRHFYV